MRKHLRVSRRAALRGMGTALALPLLEAMLPTRACAGAAEAPLRLAYLYVPNGVHMPDWTPARIGADFELSPLLEPLQPFKAQLLVLSGLTLDKARAHGDGGGDHARAMASFLTGRHPHKTSGQDIRNGVSVDQLAARQAGSATRFPSLEIGCEGGKSAGTCDNGYSCVYQTNLSWQSESTPMAKEIDPRLVFERLFGTQVGADDDAHRARRERNQQSILDFLREDATQLQTRLGAADQRKLEEYLTGVRAIEQRSQGAQPVAHVGQAQRTRPSGIPADYQEHLRLMCDMLVLAFQADLTRIATFVFANDGSNRGYRTAGVPEGHHDLSHHGNDPDKQRKIKKINLFHISQFAYLLQRLQSVREGAGTLLDHCMIVYGSGISDGDQHNHEDLPILLAGKGSGTLKTGRHLRYPRETPLTNLHLALLHRVGARVPSFGDSTGLLTSLEG